MGLRVYGFESSVSSVVFREKCLECRVESVASYPSGSSPFEHACGRRVQGLRSGVRGFGCGMEGAGSPGFGWSAAARCLRN